MKKSEIIESIIKGAYGNTTSPIDNRLLRWYDGADATLFSDWDFNKKNNKFDEENREFKMAVSEFIEYGDIVGLDKRCIDELADVIISTSMVYNELWKTNEVNLDAVIKDILAKSSEYIKLKYNTEEPWTCSIADDISRAVECKLQELKTCFEIYEHIRNNPTEFISSSLRTHQIERIVRGLISLSEFHDEDKRWTVIKTIRRVRYGFNYTR